MTYIHINTTSPSLHQNLFGLYLFICLFSTLRKRCPFFIHLRIDKAGEHLKVIKIRAGHNHELNQVRTYFRKGV